MLHSDPFSCGEGRVTPAVNSSLWLSISAFALLTHLNNISDLGVTQGQGCALGVDMASAGSLRSVPCPSLKWGKRTSAFSEEPRGMLHPRKAEHVWAPLLSLAVASWIMVPLSWPCSLGLVPLLQGGHRQAAELGTSGMQESVAGAQLLPELGCLCAVCRVSSSPPLLTLWYQHLSGSPQDAPPGRTSRPPVCIWWCLWHMCGKLWQIKGLWHSRQSCLHLPRDFSLSASQPQPC